MTPEQRAENKPRLLLLSGLLCDQTIWQDVAAYLRDVAEIDIVHFAGFSSIEAMAEHVLASVPKRFVLVGHSMGGRVALEVLRRAPERVRALGLFNTGVHPASAHEPVSRGELVELAYKHGMRALAERWLPPMLNGDAAIAPELSERLTAMIERATPASFAAQVSALLRRPDAAAVLPMIHVPTLLMSATGDRWSPIAQHEDIRRHVPHAELAVIRDAGHMAPIEQSRAVAAAMRVWVAAALGTKELDPMQRL